MDISQIIFGAIPILKQEGIVFYIKGIDGVQQIRKMIVETTPPDKGVSVGVYFDFGPINSSIITWNGEKDGCC